MTIPFRLYNIIWYLFIGFILISTAACNNNTKKKPEQTAYLYQHIERAYDIWDGGNKEYAFKYIDSIFADHGKPTVADLYDYYYFKSDRLFRDNKFDLSLMYIDSAINAIESTGNTQTLSSRYAQANYHKGDRVLMYGDYKNAYIYYYVAKKVAKSTGDSCTLAYYNYKTGLVLYNGSRYRDAIRYFERAYSQFMYCGSDFAYFYRTQQIIDNIGLSYSHLGIPDSALHYYEKAISFIEGNKNNYRKVKHWQTTVAIAVVWGNMGTAYEQKGDYEKAEEYYLKSIDVNSQPGSDAKDAQLTRGKLGLLYLKQGKTTKAYEQARFIKKAIDSLDRPAVRQRWNKLMWQYYDHQNNYGSAYVHLQNYIRIKDSLATFNRASHPIDLDEQVSTMEGRAEVAILKEANESRRLYLIAALLGCALSIVIVALIIGNWRRSRKHIAELKKMNSHVKEQREKLKYALDELENAGKEKDRILKAVSHDMRSPINSSLALVDLLNHQSDNLTEEQLEYMKLLKASGDSALNLTKDLLEVATLSNEKLEKSLTNITKEIRERVKLLQFKAAEKEQKIHFQAPDNHISATVNIEKLLRVVSNLTNNAMKFSPAGSEIYVMLKSDTNTFTIKVKDCVIGIPLSMKDKVFDLFSEAKRFGTSGEQPFGLGLSISKQIVEAHNGKIWFESEENKGTTFFVQIPTF